MKRFLSLFLVALMLLSTSCSSSKNTEESSSSMGDFISEYISENLSDEVTNDLSEENSDFSVETSSVEVSDSTSEAVSEEPSEEISEETSEETYEETSEESAEETSEEISEETSEETSEEISEEISEETSEESSEEPSEEPSEDSSEENIKDIKGYEQYLKVSKSDSVLSDRGFADAGANKDYKPINYDAMKACWISQFDFGSVYYSSRRQRSEEAFTDLVETAYDNLLSLGFNTVIVQVRPNADSFYPSAYYPWSNYVVGSYGKTAKYDPLKIMIDEAHERGLSFHAWINPMRGMSSNNLSKVSGDYTMTQWKGTRKLYSYSSLYYLNIAYEDVRQLIVDGAAEIVRNYDVDGVHMDDYFYFGETADFDEVEYKEAKAKNPSLTKKQFRYNNLNTLVSGIYSAIKAENSKVIFGISPAGNINNMATTYYADVETWLSKDGYVDYIMPQIYFGMEHQTWSFSTTYKKWAKIIKNPDIRLICGMTLTKAEDGYNGIEDSFAGSGSDEWINNKDVFKKCFEWAVKQSDFSGYAVFCYQSMFDPLTGKANVATQAEINNCKDYLTKIIKSELIK